MLCWCRTKEILANWVLHAPCATLIIVRQLNMTRMHPQIILDVKMEKIMMIITPFSMTKVEILRMIILMMMTIMTMMLMTNHVAAEDGEGDEN